MATGVVPDFPAEERTAPSANDLLKSAYGAMFWFSLILATGVHFGVFALWPEMTAEVISPRRLPWRWPAS